MQRTNIGDRRQISTNGTLLKGIVQSVSYVECEDFKGLLESYNLDGYGVTQDYFVPDETVLDAKTIQRKSRSMMPFEYVYKSAKDFKWSMYCEDVETQKKIANIFVVKFEEFKKQGRGLFISSRTKGSGKTFLACCIANEVLKNHDISVKFVTVSDYLEIIKDKDKKDLISEILNCSLLILDDIGVETDKQEWINNALFRLVDSRKNRMLPTIYTSNYAMDKLPGEERITERVIECSVPLVMPEQNIRRQKAEEKTKDFLQEVMKDDSGKEGVKHD